MNVSLPDELVSFVEDEIASGEYGTASEVVRDGLRRLRRDRAAREEKAAVLRAAVALGLQQAKAERLSERSIADIASDVRDRFERER